MLEQTLLKVYPVSVYPFCLTKQNPKFFRIAVRPAKILILQLALQLG